MVSTRRDERTERQAAARAELRRSDRRLGTEGERPAGLFGPLPVSELAILIGIVGLVVGFVQGGGPVLIVGAVIIALAVLEFTAREHFSGYRSHATLLAAAPAAAVEVALVLALSGSARDRGPLLLAVIPVFGGCFWLLRRRFAIARQARVARAARAPRA